MSTTILFFTPLVGTLVSCVPLAEDNATSSDVATDDLPVLVINDVRNNDSPCEDDSLALVSDLPPELYFDTDTGEVGINAGAATGVYIFEYRLGGEDGPTATVTVTYTPPVPCQPFVPICTCPP